jgi:hypothetical protein
MKLKLIFPIAILFIASAASAQISLGGQAGAVFSKPSTELSTGLPGLSFDIKSRTGFSAGLIADIPLGEGGFRFMPELNYVDKGFMANATVELLNQQIKAESKTNIAYIDLPINFAYAIELGGNRLMVGAGPYVGFGMSGKTKATATFNGVSQNNEKKIDFGNGEGQFDRLDIGANFMAAYILNSGLMLKVNYSLGLMNLSNNTDFEGIVLSDYKNRYFGVSLSYFFMIRFTAVPSAVFTFNI